jgi:phosphonate transport system substrate-binding protein
MFNRIAAIALIGALFFGGCLQERTDEEITQERQKIQAEETAKELGGDLENIVLKITVLPDENPTKLARKNKLLKDYLVAELGIKDIKFYPVQNYGAAVQALVSGHAHFAWLGGFTFIQAHNAVGAIPLVMRATDLQFKSIFIANKDSGIQKIEDIRGKKFAFGSKSSTSGRLMPWYFMKNTYNVDPLKDLDGNPVFSGAHDATVELVNTGAVDAGVLNYKTWNKKKRRASNTVELGLTPEYVDYCWAANPSVPEKIRDGFQNAFLKLDGSNPAHKNILELQKAEYYVVAKVEYWDKIEIVGYETGMLEKR